MSFFLVHDRVFQLLDMLAQDCIELHLFLDDLYRVQYSCMRSAPHLKADLG